MSTRLVLFALVGWALYVLGGRRSEPGGEDATATSALDAARAEKAPALAACERARHARKRQFVTSLAFAALFFAGAALSAGAGDAIVSAIESDIPPASTTTDDDPDGPNAAGGDDASSAEGEIPPPEEPLTADDPVTEPAGEAAVPDPEAALPTAPVGAPVGESGEVEASERAPVGEAAAPPSGEATAPESTADGSRSAAGETAAVPRPRAREGHEAAQSSAAHSSAARSSAARSSAPLLRPHGHSDTDDESRGLDPEAQAFGAGAVVWLHRTLPDPTPPAKRLAPAFARQLATESRRAGVDWALVLGALRADGYGGPFPAGRAHVRVLAERLRGLVGAGERAALLALRGRREFADRALALTRYNRAVGLRSLVTGLDAAKERLAAAVLADRRLDIYAGGRGDIEAGRINVRVLVLMRYLAEAHGQVTVSSLQSGHRLYARPGVISAHVYGLAVDIASLGASAILGNSQPGGVTERAIRNILLLPAELRPQQLISLLGLGGPSFPLADHDDHIHVGY